VTDRDRGSGIGQPGPSDDPLAGFLPPRRPQPTEARPRPRTDFTASAHDLPQWQQGLRTPTAEELGLIRPTKRVAQQGWRKAVHRFTNGTVNVGESAAESNLRVLADRVNQPVRGSYSIAVLSLKGGVGKTATTVGLGATFASLRGDRVIAVDANPDFGTLAQRAPRQTRSTVRDLLNGGEPLRYPDMRQHTSQISSRLEILASERDPAVSEAFSEDDYRAVHRILDRFYNIILTDCGTGMTHSAMRGVLDLADALIVVASPAIDSARSALATLDWLMCHGYAHLVPEACVVLSTARPGAIPIDLEQLGRHFRLRVRSLFLISYDQHLGEGGEINLDLINRKTREEYMELAATMADAFARAPSGPKAVRQ
jgi:MinD-like ATPase involved in chromosome partitioning or flagellar assembly